MKLLYSVSKNENFIKVYNYNGDKLNEINKYNLNFSSSYSILFDRKCLDNKLEIDKLIRYILFQSKKKHMMIHFKMKKIFHIIHQQTKMEIKMKKN